MAWSGADISAADLAYFAEDKPILSGINALETPQSMKWATTANGSDITLSGYPVTRAYDRLGHLRTKPNTSGTEFWLQCQLSASVADFDGVLVWGTAGLDGVTVAVRIADDNAYTSNAEELATDTASGTTRLAFLDLQATGDTVSNRFSSVPYFWLRFTKGSAFTPEVGEVWLIRRRQMAHHPRLSWDPTRYRSEWVTNRSRAGVAVTYTHHSGRKDLEASWNPSVTTDQSVFSDFFADCGYGTKPFAFIDNPSSAPEEFRIIVPSGGGFDFPYVGWSERQVTISGSEAYPFQETE